MPGSGLYSSGDGNPSRTTTRLIPTHKLLLNTPIIAQEGTGDCQTAVARMMLGTILAYPEVHRLEESVDKYLRLKADLLNWAIRKGIFERHWGKPCSQTFVTDMIPHEYLEHLLVPLRVESWWHYLAGGPPSESRLLEELRHYRPVGLFLAPVNGLDSQGHLHCVVPEDPLKHLLGRHLLRGAARDSAPTLALGVLHMCMRMRTCIRHAHALGVPAPCSAAR